MSKPLRVLLVEDSPDDATLTLHALKKSGFDVTHERVETAPAMRAALQAKTWDVIVSDYSMPEFTGPEAFKTLVSVGLDLPFLIVSGTVGEETAVQAMRMGVHDYLLKGNLQRLGPAIEREMRECETRRAHARAEEARQLAEQNLRDAEDQLRQAQKMEAVGRLAGGVAHDFNNLLTVILSYSTMIADNEDVDDVTRADVDEIRKAGERAAELTRQLLVFSRQQVLKPRVLSLDHVLKDVEKMLHRLLGADITLSIIPSPEVGKIHADPGQLEQVIMNLVVNARDAMPNGGQITIETSHVTLGGDHALQHLDVEPGHYAILSVTDTGTGMDKATQARIFEPFFTTKEPGKGTGLGLSTVYGIVKQNHGHIALDSELNRGTTFRIYLPRTDAREDQAVTKSNGTHSLQGTETVLVVEDQEQVRVIMTGILRKHGYRVLEAQNGGEAFLVCEKHSDPIDLVISDVVMPRMNGHELVSRLRQMRPSMKVLLVSGYVERLSGDSAVLDSDVAFLQKPILPEMFASKVREVLGVTSH